MRRPLSIGLLLLTAGCGSKSELAVASDSDGEDCVAQARFEDADGDGHGDPYTVQMACPEATGLVDKGDDCDDTDAEQRPGQSWFQDADGDGHGDAAVSVTSCLRPLGHITDSSDCDDRDGTRAPGLQWYADADEDGHGDPGDARDSCGDVTGAVPTGTDCDDTDWLVNPDASEVCNAVDDDCDGLTDDDDPDVDPLTRERLFVDDDGDGWGTEVVLGDFCESLPNGALVSGDCDDGDPLVHPERLDYADDIDSDCDGEDAVYFPENSAYTVEGFESGGFTVGMTSKDIDGDGIFEVLVAAIGAGPEDEGVIGLLDGSQLTSGREDWPDEAPLWTGSELDGALGTGLCFIGDWDGDGSEDFVAGAPEANENAGVMHILSTADTTGGVDDALFTYAHSEPDAYLGQSCAPLGDITGDGHADVLVSMRRDSRLNTNQGSVLMIPGGGSMSDVLLTNGEGNSDQLGFGMANLGDVDGDGVDDIALGAPYADLVAKNGGEIYLFAAPAFADLVAPADADMVFGGPDEQARGGQVLAAPGDINQDGYDDLLIGASGYEHNDAAIDDAGAAYVVLGSGTGWASGDLADAWWRLYDTTEDHFAGRYLGTPGDIDGDGGADILVTAYGWDLGEDRNLGKVYGILSGHGSGTWMLDEDADLVLAGTSHGDYLGRGIAPAGDVDADGRDDVWVGSSSAGPRGRLYLLHGAATPF